MSKKLFKHNTIKDCQILDIPKIEDIRGNLAVIENDLLPFKIKRVYFLYNVPTGAYRGGHAHKEQLELLIAVSGSFEVTVDDGKNKKKFILNRPDKALLLPQGIWRELKDFSQGSVCLVLNSEKFKESDYIREYGEFILKKS